MEPSSPLKIKAKLGEPVTVSASSSLTPSPTTSPLRRDSMDESPRLNRPPSPLKATSRAYMPDRVPSPTPIAPIGSMAYGRGPSMPVYVPMPQFYPTYAPQ